MAEKNAEGKTITWEAIGHYESHLMHYSCSIPLKLYRKVNQRFPLIYMLAHLLFLLFCYITPNVPVDLQHTGKKVRGWKVLFSGGWRVFWITGTVAFLFCMPGTIIATIRSGTFYGTQAGMEYFVQDPADLIDYLFICPIYVGFASWIIYLMLSKVRAIDNLADNCLQRETIPRGERRRKQNPFTAICKAIREHALNFTTSFIAIAAFTYGMTYMYISNILTVSRVNKRYWFMSDTAINGHWQLNDAGKYYAVLNFFLLLVTAMAVMSFFRLFIETLRVGNRITKDTVNQHMSFEAIQHTLKYFTESYLVAKALCIVYLFNIITWNYSTLVHTNNYWISVIMILIMAVIFISYPRYYVEYQWHNYKHHGGLMKSPEPVKSIRSERDRVLAKLMDAAISLMLISPLLSALYEKFLAPYVKILERMMSS
jgi:hypothetical protein